MTVPTQATQATQETDILDVVNDVPEVEIAPEFEGAIELALKNFGETWNLSGQPELVKALVSHFRLAFSQIKLPSAQKKTRGTSGYNEYIKSRWEQVRAAKKAAKQSGGGGGGETTETPQETMSEFAKDWKSMSATDQQKYHDLAKQKNSENFPSKSKKSQRKKGPMSGYNYFIKVKTAELKETDSGLQSMDRMKHISTLWNGLTQVERDQFKKVASDEFWAENPDLWEERQREKAEAEQKAKEKALEDAAVLSAIRQPVVGPPPVIVPSQNPK